VIKNPDFPFLISFPRTGSHWLRLAMELYFEKPSLVRIFYYKNASEFTCYHRHDEDLSIRRKNVIYLYRHPLDTVYSQLKYYNENIHDRQRIKYWTDLFGCHLKKWLVEETFTAKKTVLTYEGMSKNMEGEFKKICSHFSMALDKEKFQAALAKVSKREVKKKTTHDRQVINLSEAYQVEKREFKKTYSTLIMDGIYSVDKELKRFFLHSF
jgi:hypothetical protein